MWTCHSENDPTLLNLQKTSCTFNTAKEESLQKNRNRFHWKCTYLLNQFTIKLINYTLIIEAFDRNLLEIWWIGLDNAIMLTTWFIVALVDLWEVRERGVGTRSLLWFIGMFLESCSLLDVRIFWEYKLRSFTQRLLNENFTLILIMEAIKISIIEEIREQFHLDHSRVNKEAANAREHPWTIQKWAILYLALIYLANEPTKSWFVGLFAIYLDLSPRLNVQR